MKITNGYRVEVEVLADDCGTWKGVWKLRDTATGQIRDEGEVRDGYDEASIARAAAISAGEDKASVMPRPRGNFGWDPQ